MKKALLILLALTLVGAVYAEPPKPEMKVAEFTGSATVVAGVDLDNGALAFGNTATASLKLDLIGAGDKVTTGENIWGEIKIKTDGDPIRIAANEIGYPYTPGNATVLAAGYPVTGYKVIVDVAKLNFGKTAYLGIKKDTTTLEYASVGETGARFLKINNAQWYGQSAGTYIINNTPAAVGPAAMYGMVFGYVIPATATITGDFRSFDDWNSATKTTAGDFAKVEATKNSFGFRGKVDVTAIKDVTLQAGVATGFGGKDQYYDMAFGGKVGYKLMLDKVMYVKPIVGADVVMDNAGATNSVKGTEKMGYAVQAGALFGWGARNDEPGLYFTAADPGDFGYFPGISAAAVIYSKDVFGATKDMAVGLNASMFSGTIVPNLSAAAGLEIADLMADKMVMGFMATGKYSIVQGAMTMSPKGGLYYYSDAAGATDEAKTDIYVKAGLELAKIFPNTTLTFEYASNDFNGTVGNVKSGTVNWNTNTKNGSLGMFSTTLKIAF